MHRSRTAVALGIVVASLGVFGYGYRQYQGYQKTKQSYNLKLTQSLYYQNLENNAGVLYRLLDDAEEQECREAILAYFVLWGHAGGAGLTGGDLDDRVEQFLERHAGVKVDFEVGDAVAKLERLRIVERLGDRYRARPLAQALQVLDWSWDNFFKFSTAGDPLDAQAAGFLGNAGGVSRHWRLR